MLSESFLDLKRIFFISPDLSIGDEVDDCLTLSLPSLDVSLGLDAVIPVSSSSASGKD
jgi:hypothetical protein